MHRKDRGSHAQRATADARTTVRGKDILRALPALSRDLPSLLRGGKKFATLKGTSKQSIGLAFQRQATKHPERIFIRFEGTDLSYGDANARVNQYAAVLAERGVAGGSVVGVLSTNRPETLLVALAVAAAQRGHARGEHTLITTSSPGGQRGAAVVSAATMEGISIL